MGDRGKGCAWLFLAGAAGCVAIFVVLLLLLPRILNLDFVKARVIRLASEMLGAGVGYQKAELSLFPYPQVVIREGLVIRPGEMEIRLATLAAGTDLVPLLHGNFTPARIRIDAPSLRLELSEEGADGSGLSLQETVRQEVASVLSVLTSQMPGLVMEIEQGTMELCRQDRPVFQVAGLRARVDSRTDRVLVDLSCRSGLWEELNLTGSLGSALEGASRIRLRGFDATLVLGDSAPSILARLEPVDLDLEIDFGGHVPDSFEAEFLGSLPSLRTQPPGAKKIAEGLQFSGAFGLEGRRVTVSLNPLILDYPRLKVKAGLSIDQDASQVSLEAEAEGIDVEGLREVALMTGGEDPLVQEICGYVRGGDISSIVLRSHGTKLVDLGSLENLSVRCRFREAGIVLSDPGVELAGVGGEVALSPGLLEGKDLKGSLGMSSFAGVTLRLDLEKALYLKNLSGDFSLSLDEIHRRLLSLEDFRGATKEVKKLKGTMALRVKSLSGPVEKPDKWRFEAEGTLKGVLVEASLLPGSVNVSRGSFRADRDRIHLKGVCAHFLDAECIVSGRLDGYREGLWAVEGRLTGDVGTEANRWVSEQIELPPEFRLRAPYRVPETVFKWEKRKDILLKGTLLSSRGPRVSVDLVLKPEGVVVNELSIEHQRSKASMALKEMKDAFYVAFQGRLEKAALDDLLMENTILAGNIEGDLETKMVMDQPMESRATGTLRAEGLSLPLPLRFPVILEDLSLRVQDNQTRVERARFLWEKEEFLLEGDVSFSPEGFVLDMDVLAGDLDWSRMEKALQAEEEREIALSKEDLMHQDGRRDRLAVEGNVRVKADSFTVEEFTWQPMAVDILLQGEGVEILLKDADLCGVATVGVVKVLPTDLSLDLAISCRDKKIENVLECIRVDAEATGECDLKMNLAGKGRAEELPKVLQGDFELSCREGTILKDPVISAILAFLNTTEILRGKLPDFRKQGFPYHSIRARGVLQSGSLKLEEVVIDGTTVDIYSIGEVNLIARTLNVRVLVSSLQRVEFIVSKIPLVSYLVGGGGVTAIPVRVRGPLDNPITVPLSPTALGEDLLGIAGRTLRLPYEAIQFLLPRNEKKQ